MSANSRGFTLFEVLAASAVLSVAVAAILHSVSTAQQQTHAALSDLRATSLAEALMEEIVALPYADPDGASVAGPEAGEVSRDGFDNADDFDGFQEDEGETMDCQGTAYPAEFGRFSRSVTAAYTTTEIPALGGSISGLNVTVTVTDHQGRSWSIARFITEPAE